MSGVVKLNGDEVLATPDTMRRIVSGANIDEVVKVIGAEEAAKYSNDPMYTPIWGVDGEYLFAKLKEPRRNIEPIGFVHMSTAGYTSEESDNE